GPAASMGIARRPGLEFCLPERHQGLLAEIREGYCDERLVTWSALRIIRDVGEHEPLGFHDFLVDARTPKFGAVGGAHTFSPSAARADVHRDRDHGETLRAPPLSRPVRFGPRLEHEAAGRVKNACDE